MNTNQPEQIGRYRLVERVGRGAMGVLYRGIDPVLDREVAIKLMLLDFSEDKEQMRARFFREARAIAKLQHRNIVTVFEFAEENNTPYIVMEYLNGSSLASRMASPRPLSLDEKLGITIQLCDALNYAHQQGVVHRDVKPANVFLLSDGSVKLLDFGIAKLQSSTLTRTAEVFGSVAYMSPEQVASSNVDGRADIFSTGVVLYELLARRKPFESPHATATIMKILHEPPPPLDDVTGLPRPLLAVVSRALEKKLENRYQTAGELAEALESVRRSLGGGGVDAEQAELVAKSEAEIRQYQELVAAPTIQESHSAILSPTSLAEPTGFASPTSRRRADSTTPAAVEIEEPEPEPQAARRWAIPAAIAAVGLIGIVGLLMFRGWSSEPTPAAPAAATAAPSNQPASGTPASGTPASAAAAGSSAATRGTAPASTDRVPLRVESTPAGATIWVDGRDINQATPATINVIGGTSHRLRLTKRGFTAHEATITADDLRNGTVSFGLDAVAATATTGGGESTPSAGKSAGSGGGSVALSIHSTYPVEVFSGARSLAGPSESHELKVDAGTTVHVRSPQYMLDASVKAEGRTLDYQAPAIGYLTVLTKYETCKVKIGDRDLGFPPITKMPIASGQHRVDISCANGPNPPGQLVTVLPNTIATSRIY